MDDVFKALADPTRRALLDRLHAESGLTLGELCEPVAMTRQAATQHLEILQAANLITTVRRGRAKLHYLNPVPLHEMQERWIDKFERPRLRAMGAIKRQAEEAMIASSRPTFSYATFIQSTPEKVWDALTDADVTAAYWGHANVSDWQVGSAWEHRRLDGSGIADVVGTVVESTPPHRLVMTWSPPDDDDPARTSQVTFDIRPHGDTVRLTVTHEHLADAAEHDAAANGWSAVLSNLKSLLETGRPLSDDPWLTHRSATP
jgi:uncharacterized protein YndB with AHSA1/START domain/DNA-binding transcriptional ArsR family regulator